jgi:glycosyltransferase involved in cell wall biosynthesis
LAAYGGPYPGSFVPMLEAAHEAVQSQGWSFEAVMTPAVEERPWYADLRERGVTTRIAPRTDRRNATAWLRTMLAEQAEPVLLHTHFSDFDVPAVIAARGHPGTSVLWHLHSPISRTLPVRATNTVRFGVFGRLADRILCVGARIREDAVRRLAPPGRTQVFLNGIDVNRFSSIDSADRAAARVRMELPADSVVLLLFAWDWERKGGPLLLKTVSELRQRRRDVVALVVGAPERARDEADRLRLGEAIRTVAPTDDTRALYAVADVFISASTAEGLPFAMLEALCSGVPVVASDIPSHSDVSGGLPACRLASRDARAFSDMVEAELDSAVADRITRLAASRAEIENSLSLQSWSERLVGVYRQVLSTRARGASPQS